MRRSPLRYATAQQLLDMEKIDRADLERRFKEALKHMHGSGRLHPSDLQLPIQPSPPTNVKLIEGYEDGEFNPEKLGVACIVRPPSEGRGANTR